MPAPGFSIPELFAALQRCRKIYNAFRDPHGNAPARLASFDQEIQRVEESLAFQKRIYEWSGREYPGAKAFAVILEECEAYLRQHQSLLDRDSGKESVKGIAQTVFHAFQDNITRLRQSLAHNRLDFLNWNLPLPEAPAFPPNHKQLHYSR